MAKLATLFVLTCAAFVICNMLHDIILLLRALLVAVEHLQ
jgi:hypothetical protein